ncbi:MAG: M20/M25/M40 family metallo-hydrolase [Acidobacteria bacterium]|nr:M20/M25/M40 family metallo-hydrolase [Acidobacteriota bacterium]
MSRSLLSKLLFTLAAAAIAIPLFLFAQETVDLAIVNRIRAEAFDNSKVMDHMFYLTDVYGPRVANSPGYHQAADWVVKRMQEYGIPAKLENWDFGRGWAFSHYEGHLIEPQYAPIIGFPLAWSPSTDGTVTGEPMLAILRSAEDLEKYKGKLKGKIIMTSQPRALNVIANAPLKRYSEAELSETAVAPEPGAPSFGFGGPSRGPRSAFDPQPPQNMAQMREFRPKLQAFLHDEAPALIIQSSLTGDGGGTVFGSQGGSRDPKDPVPPPMVVIAAEHYNRIVRLIEHKIPVKVAFNIKAELLDKKDDVNVVAEIEGGRKKDEIVMLGAHLDSWQGGTGATDNGAGSAVMIEAMRILKSLNVKMDRTVRLGLWGGEEEGLLGSRAYVKAHFADPEVMKPTAEHAKIAGYFNVDNGTGKLRGVYLQGNDMVRPIFNTWMEPFRDLGFTTLTIRNTGGTDHLSFDGVGLPGFQFIQDPVEYSARTHHSNMDVYDRIQKGDLMQAAAIVASFAYNTAMRDEMLPRKPLPKPQPRRGGPGGAGRPSTN